MEIFIQQTSEHNKAHYTHCIKLFLAPFVPPTPHHPSNPQNSVVTE